MRFPNQTQIYQQRAEPLLVQWIKAQPLTKYCLHNELF